MASGTIDVITNQLQDMKTEILGEAITFGDFLVETHSSNNTTIDPTGQYSARDFSVDLTHNGYTPLMTDPYITGESGSWASYCSMSNNRMEGNTYLAVIRNNKGDVAANVRLAVKTLYIRNKGV